MAKKCQLILVIILCASLFAGCSTKKDTEHQVPSVAPEVQETTSIVFETIDAELLSEKTFMEIETPYVVLQYPSRWEETVRVEQIEDDVYTVAFYGTVENREEHHLFDILFGDGDGFEIGKILVDGKVVRMCVVTYDLKTDESWSDEEILELKGMREDVQHIISSVSTLVADFESSSFAIDTPYVTLYYPSIWKESARIEQKEGTPYGLEFYAVIDGRGEIPIFDLIFGGESGDCLGYISHNGEKIRLNIVSHSVEISDDWTEEEVSTVYGMKDDVNYIITALVETGLFQYPEE